MNIPIKIIIIDNVITIESIIDNIQVINVSGAEFANHIKFEHLLEAKDLDKCKVIHSTELVNTLRQEIEKQQVLFYMIVCEQYYFIVEDEQSITIDHIKSNKRQR